MQTRRNPQQTVPITYSAGRPPSVPRRSWRRRLAIELGTALLGGALIIRCAAGVPGVPGFALFAAAFFAWPWAVQPLVQAAADARQHLSASPPAASPPR